MGFIIDFILFPIQSLITRFKFSTAVCSDASLGCLWTKQHFLNCLMISAIPHWHPFVSIIIIFIYCRSVHQQTPANSEEPCHLIICSQRSISYLMHYIVSQILLRDTLRAPSGFSSLILSLAIMYTNQFIRQWKIVV